MTTKPIFSVLIAITIACVTRSTAMAQAGVSSMSMGASRAGIHLRFDDIRIEEYVNYHRHLLPLPQQGERVRLDTRWRKLDSGNSVLQIGLTTPRSIDRELARPLNLVLVIDRSGSMAGDRIANVKKSIFAFVEKLRKQDSVAIVSYSSNARVDLSACCKTNHARIAKAIESLAADQSTNLHAGLMLGYQEAIKSFDPDKSNRVILLTDGMANEGVADPAQIARESSRFNKEGIELSVIGLGDNFNRDLLRKLADAGRGLLHFVNDRQDIRKTFVDEIDSLLSPAARKVKLTIDFGDRNKLPKVFGYEPTIDGSKMSFRLDNLNCGATQVVLFEFKQKAETRPVRVELNYVDQIDHSPVSVCRTAKLETGKNSSDFELTDDLDKNYAIARVADSLKQSVKFCERNDYEKAAKKLNQGIRYARAEFHEGCDQDIDRIVKIASKQQQQLTAAIESQRRMETSHHHRRK